MNDWAPLIGVALGAFLTHVFGARGRDRQRVETLFDTAISAVAVMQASRMVPSLIHSGLLEPDERAGLEKELKAEGFRQFVQHAAECRKALAALHPYCPSLRPYWEKFEIAESEVDSVIGILDDCHPRHQPLLQRVFNTSWVVRR